MTTRVHAPAGAAKTKTLPRSLRPREHGAYGVLAFPLIVALAGAHLTLAGACYALAACAAFVAHEPALVLLGHRGTRAQRETSARAWRWVIAALSAAAALAGVGLALSPAARPFTLLPAGLGAIATLTALRRQERSLFGESLVSAALPSAAVPTAIACGLAWQDALALWAVFVVSFLVSTVEVRSIVHRGGHRVVHVATWAGAIVAVVAIGLSRPLLAIAAVPTLLVLVFAAGSTPSPVLLRRLGWRLVASSALAAVLAIGALRVAG